MTRAIPIRSQDRRIAQVGDFFDSTKRYYDNVAEHMVVKLFTGDCYVTQNPRELLITILGSCVAVCMRDPVARVGGMNHILLPGTGSVDDIQGNPTRYGAFAMEQLINGLLKMGAVKQRLECKLFGGGNVLRNSSLIGENNIHFVRHYLHNEGLLIHAEDTGGEYPRRIHYFPDTGRVRMRRLKREDDMLITQRESQFVTQIDQPVSTSDNIELF